MADNEVLNRYRALSRERLKTFSGESSSETALTKLMQLYGYNMPSSQFYNRDYRFDGPTSMGYRDRGDNENIYLNQPDSSNVNPFGRFRPTIVPLPGNEIGIQTPSTLDSMRVKAHEITHFFDSDTNFYREIPYEDRPSEKKANRGALDLMMAVDKFMSGDTTSALKGVDRWKKYNKMRDPNGR